MKSGVFILFLMSLSFQSCQHRLYEKQLQLLYKNTLPVIYPEKLASLKNNNSPFYLLDTRLPQEFAVSHLAGAWLAAGHPVDLQLVKDIPQDALIIVYCTVGVRSERVGEQLKEAGYTQVFNLFGGLIAWKNKGFPVVNPLGQTTDQVHTYNRYWGVWLQNGEKVYE